MTITWTFHGRDVSMDREFSTQAVGTRTKMLVIPSVSHGHSGTYTCIAKNAAGRAEYATQLVVKGQFGGCIEPLFHFNDYPESSFLTSLPCLDQRTSSYQIFLE